MFSRALAIGTLVLGWAVAAVTMAIPSDVDATSPPIQFTPIYKNNLGEVSLDLSSVNSMIDKDGDLLVGAITELRTANRRYVGAVVAVCGYNGLVILRSRTYALSGELLEDTEKPIPLALKDDDSTATATYKFLCASKTKPTPPNPGYKSPERYNSLWT